MTGRAIADRCEVSSAFDAVKILVVRKSRARDRAVRKADIFNSLS
jgi:hypothetical protein